MSLGNLTNLICRKLTLKLKNMLAERIATDLILNEEKEKITNKKNSKKKKATKKQNKECSPPSKLILEQGIICLIVFSCEFIHKVPYFDLFF